MSWWRWHRDDEDRLGEVERELGDQRAFLDELERILEREGARLRSAAADAVEGVPPGLIVAARTRSSAGEPVHASFAGCEAIAVVGPGDPNRIWPEICRRAAEPPHRGPAVVRLMQGPLPDGLLAVAIPGVTVTVSALLSAQGRRQAMRTALSAARRAGWMPSRVPALLLPLLARKPLAAFIAAGTKAHAAAAAAAAVAAAGVVTVALVAAPPAAVRATTSLPRPPVVRVHGHRRRVVRAVRKGSYRKQSGSVVAMGTSPKPHPGVQGSGSAAPAHSATPAPGRSSDPAPSVSVSVSATPAPSASVSVSPPGICLGLLILGVCVPL